jgi:hypothetical protein
VRFSSAAFLFTGSVLKVKQMAVTHVDSCSVLVASTGVPLGADAAGSCREVIQVAIFLPGFPDGNIPFLANEVLFLLAVDEVVHPLTFSLFGAIGGHVPLGEVGAVGR